MPQITGKIAYPYGIYRVWNKETVFPKNVVDKEENFIGERDDWKQEFHDKRHSFITLSGRHTLK